jgi:hypothetical protein
VLTYDAHDRSQITNDRVQLLDVIQYQ